jgi:hypothetical protein
MEYQKKRLVTFELLPKVISNLFLKENLKLSKEVKERTKRKKIPAPERKFESME